MTDTRYRLLQFGQPVAEVSGQEGAAWQEIKHYAAVYTADGPVSIQRHVNGKWTSQWAEIAYQEGRSMRNDP